MSDDRDALPKGWRAACLPDLIGPDGMLTDGDWVESKDQDPNGEVRLTQLADIGDGEFRDRSHRFLTIERAAALGCTFLQKGDVMVARMPDPLGRACIFPGDDRPCVTAVDVCLIRPGGGPVSSRWLMNFINAPAYRAAIADLQAGSTRKRISKKNLCSIPLPVPPAPEQLRIVNAIESYLTRLDDAVATLERVQRNLKRYRASVLTAAVEGRLVPTEAQLGRAEGRDYEPASVLLDHILAERRRRWETSERGGRYLEPVAPSTSDLPELPEGWCWATLDGVADLKGGITKGQRRGPTDVLRDVAYLRVANVQRGRIDLSVVKTIPATEAEIDELRLHPGDVLFNEGGDRDKLGRGWVWNGELPECIHQNHVFRARILTADLHPKFLSWYGNTAGQQYFFEEGKQTTNLASINLTKLRRLPVPIPPLAEQTRIVEEVERLLSLANEADLLVDVDARRCARLRQSILKWAFEGRLADQDHNDEPASVLLARIKTEREAAGTSKKKNGRPSRPVRKTA